MATWEFTNPRIPLKLSGIFVGFRLEISKLKNVNLVARIPKSLAKIDKLQMRGKIGFLRWEP